VHGDDAKTCETCRRDEWVRDEDVRHVVEAASSDVGLFRVGSERLRERSDPTGGPRCELLDTSIDRLRTTG
jgi:hypothetical protein